MKKIAVVAVAGWKGGGEGYGRLVGCPEPLLPLPGGETIVSRLIKQLKGFGFEIIIGAGTVGYPYHAYAPFCKDGEISPELLEALDENGFLLEDSPWTQERIDYLSKLGTVVHMPDPGSSSRHDTFCRIIDTLDTWDNLMLVHGDMMFVDKFLQDVINLPWPCQFSMHPVHTIFMLDYDKGMMYREYSEQYREGGVARADKKHITLDWPGGQIGAHRLATEFGLPAYGMITIGRPNLEIEWLDVDEPQKYREALRRIKEREM
jgi:NDP-sugar pyrophosphorylase family protein